MFVSGIATNVPDDIDGLVSAYTLTAFWQGTKVVLVPSPVSVDKLEVGIFPLAVPVSAAEIVPAEKFPEESRLTIALAVLALVGAIPPTLNVPVKFTFSGQAPLSSGLAINGRSAAIVASDARRAAAMMMFFIFLTPID